VEQKRGTADEVPASREKVDQVLVCGGIYLDPALHIARPEKGGPPFPLTAGEFALLQFLMRSPGWVFSRSQIIDAVKGDDYPVTDRSVDVAILGLRKKLGPWALVVDTVRGVGYRFLAPEAQS
jgi:two-component system phosphate regulon response regulator PhoB